MTMAAAASTPSVRRFEMARVGELTFGILRREFALNYGLAVAISAIPVLLGAFTTQASVLKIQTTVPGRLPHLFAPGAILAGLLSFLAALLIYAALSWGAVERLQARSPSMQAKLAKGVRALPVLIGVILLAYLVALVVVIVIAVATVLIPGVKGTSSAVLMIGGTILLALVAAFVLGVRWAPAVPAVAVERTGVFSTFRRSAELTKGHRWAVFLLLLIYSVGVAVLSLALGLLVRAAFGVSGSLFVVHALSGPALYATAIVRLLVGGLGQVVGGVGIGVVYHELRAEKGGFDTRQLADVFA